MFGMGIPEVVMTGLTLLLVIEALLMFLLPFFVYTIRAESIRTNQLLEDIAEALQSRDTAG